MASIDERCVSTIRFLAVDQVEKAKSGHPGMPLGAAPMAYVLWDRFLRFDATNPKWPNRDRFILSAGHGSALLYALLHLYGYSISIEDLKRFRQWGSKTPGHPEYGEVPGVEATTGPLGQGFAMGVGMAIAEAHLAAVYNRDGFPLVDGTIYAIVSDGDLMEGIASEAASLAGHLKLGKLVYLYDDNHISIEGSTELAFGEDVGARFAAYGWHVQKVSDSEDLGLIESAIGAAKAETDRPSLIMVRTHIGFGSPKKDSAKAHGEPLGAEAMKATREELGWPADKTFYVPDDVYNHAKLAQEKGALARASWDKLLKGYEEAYPDNARWFKAAVAGELPSGWEKSLPVFKPADGAMATRAASGKVLNALAPAVTNLIGGSADLGPSNNTALKDSGDFSAKDRAGRNIHFGVREHAMAAAVNGMALYGGVLPFGATFLVFSDYMRPSLRLAALMQTHSIFIFTHDSIAVGEDGPTHQPVDQLPSLRSIPGFTVFRPADANETAIAWRCAIEAKGPVALVLTRQNLSVLDASAFPIAEGVPKGGYILAEAEGGKPRAVIAASGSEVHLAISARTILAAEGAQVRVVSVPCRELFTEQPKAYRDSVIPPGLPVLAVEMASPMGWRDYLGARAEVMGINRFGASAPGPEVVEKLGFTAEAVAARLRALL